MDQRTEIPERQAFHLPFLCGFILLTVIEPAGTRYIMHNDACALTWSVLCYNHFLKVTHAVTLIILISVLTIFFTDTHFDTSTTNSF